MYINTVQNVQNKKRRARFLTRTRFGCFLAHDFMTTPLDIKAMQLRMLKTANPLKYNSEMCKYIQERTSHIDLPKLTREEMSQLKEHLADFQQIKSKDLRYTFYNLRNCFLICNEFEENPAMRQKLAPIITYLNDYNYVFDLFIESQSQRDSPMLDKALIILHLDISKFCMRYAHLLTDTDLNTINFAPADVPHLDADDLNTPAREPEPDDSQTDLSDVGEPYTPDDFQEENLD